MKDSNMTELLADTDPKRINKAIAYASRLLGMREYSEKLLRQKIVIKGYLQEEAQSVIDYLLENNWLSDERFCQTFVRSKANRGKGPVRIAFELTDKGISSQLQHQVMEELDIDWQACCDQVAERKVNSSQLQNKLQDRQKLERFLRYRGFSGEQIRSSTNKFIK